MALKDPEIESLVAQHWRELARFEKTATFVAEEISRRARGEALRHLLSFRAKHPDDLRGKLARKRDDERYAFANLQRDLCAVVTDLAGCRLVVYNPRDEDRMATLVREAFPLVDGPRSFEVKREGNGYHATHVLVRVPLTAEPSIRGTICEVQVCPLASHLFNELEHDISYKQPSGAPSANEQAHLKEIVSAVHLANVAAARLMDAHALRITRSTQLIGTAGELKHVLEQKAGRVLRGDFARLLGLLLPTVEKLTPGAVDVLLGSLQTTMERGRQIARESGTQPDVDDVVAVVLGLADEFGQEFAAIAKTWKGPSTALKNAILRFVESR